MTPAHQLELRPYQTEAFDAAVPHLRAGGRGQLHAACGSGKTIVALRVAEAVCPAAGLIVVLCPTLGLVGQTLESWTTHHARSFTALAVGSDETLAEAAAVEAAAEDLPCPVTTDPAEIQRWVGAGGSSGVRLIVGTHRSAGRIGEALLALDTKAAVLIVDEAHHTAGAAGKHGALVHDNTRLPAERRLYLTATPRILIQRGGRVGAEPLLTMDDPSVFGPVLHSYPFSRGIEEGWLDDYRVVVIGITQGDVLEVLREVGGQHDSGLGPSPQVAAVQVALGRAVQEWGLRRVIAFAPRIADATEFARTLPGTLARALPDLAPPHSDWVSGLHSVEQRDLKLDQLRRPPADGWTVLANSRVLIEGVDLPAVDAIVFTAPKRSTVDIVQAVGRAMRPHPDGPSTATIVVPILLPDDQPLVEVEDAPEWDILWQVVRALRAHDDILAADLDRRRESTGDYAQTPPSRLVFRMPDQLDGDRWLDTITAKLVDLTTSPWWEGLGAARRYHAQHGNLDVAPEFVDDQGFALGQWIPSQRHLRRREALAPDRQQALDDLGIVWDPRAVLWQDGVDAASAFVTQHGHLDVPATHMTDDGFPLGTWTMNRRHDHRNGDLAADRVAALVALDPLWDHPKLSHGLTTARSYHAQHGNLNVQARHREGGLDLGEWLRKCRLERAAGALPAPVAQELDSLGMRWEVRSESWDRHLAAAARFQTEHGHLRIPLAFCDGELKLGEWLMKARHEHGRGKLSAQRIAALDALGIEWESQSERVWQAGLAELSRFRAEHGHVQVPSGFRTASLDLPAWIETRRQEYRTRVLAPERVTALEALGIEWDPRGARRAVAMAAVEDYYSQHGHLQIPVSFRTPDGLRLGDWLHSRRKRFRAGTLDAAQADALAAIDASWAERQRASRGKTGPPPSTPPS